MNGTSTWINASTATPGQRRKSIGAVVRPLSRSRILTMPSRASSTRQPKVRMMIEVSSGAISMKMTRPCQRPAWRTMNQATG